MLSVPPPSCSLWLGLQLLSLPRYSNQPAVDPPPPGQVAGGRPKHGESISSPRTRRKRGFMTDCRDAGMQQWLGPPFGMHACATGGWGWGNGESKHAFYRIVYKTHQHLLPSKQARFGKPQSVLSCIVFFTFDFCAASTGTWFDIIFLISWLERSCSLRLIVLKAWLDFMTLCIVGWFVAGIQTVVFNNKLEQYYWQYLIG